VVKEALRERYARIKRRTGKASVEELLAIADRAAFRLKRPTWIMANAFTMKPACRKNDRRYLGWGGHPLSRAGWARFAQLIYDADVCRLSVRRPSCTAPTS
jgi:hypothetical protein